VAQDGGDGAAGTSVVARTESDAGVWSLPLTGVTADGVDVTDGAVAVTAADVDSLFVSDFNRSTVAYASPSCTRRFSTSRVFSSSADCSCRTSSSS